MAENRNTTTENESGRRHERFGVTGMHCAACAARAERTLLRMDGVDEATVNFATEEADVTFRPDRTDAAQMGAALQRVGLGLTPMAAAGNGTESTEENAAANDEARQHAQLRRSTVCATAATAVVMATGMTQPAGGQWAAAVMWLLATGVVFGAGRGFFANAWRQARIGTASMDTLVALSTGIAYAFSTLGAVAPALWTAHGLAAPVYFDSACGVITFVLVGRLLEVRARRGTAAALRALAGLQPQTTVVVLPDGRQETRAIADVRRGDVLRVLPGERIAVDGTVVEGQSYVDESAMNGEPLPARKTAGDRLLAGTHNGSGSLTFRAEQVGGDTVLARIVELVRTAQNSKAPVQRTVDKVAAVFVPAVIGTALLTLFGWWALSPSDGLGRGLLAAVTVLVVACPCALGLATPTALTAGIGRAARGGMLVRDAESLQTARRTNTVVLDKTGTLTTGQPVVTAMRWYGRGEACRAVFHALESRSEHPLAHAVTTSPDIATDGVLPTIDGFAAVAGRGVRGRCDTTEYFAGNAAFMTEAAGVDSETLRRATDEAGPAGSLVCFAAQGELLGVAVIEDPLRPTARQAVERLHRHGIEVHLLSGDRTTAVAATARAAGIAHLRGDMLPDGKAAYIAELQARGRIVAMAGDGINDSAAMAQADLSMAMGRGSDIAMDIAQITIVHSDLTKIDEVIALSRRTVRIIRQNLFWAFVYNTLAIPVAAGALYPLCGLQLTPAMAAAAMTLSSLSVVGNSLRLRR